MRDVIYSARPRHSMAQCRCLALTCILMHWSHYFNNYKSGLTWTPSPKSSPHFIPVHSRSRLEEQLLGGQGGDIGLGYFNRQVQKCPPCFRIGPATVFISISFTSFVSFEASRLDTCAAVIVRVRIRKRPWKRERESVSESGKHLCLCESSCDEQS